MATTATRNGNTLYITAGSSPSTIDALTAKNIVVTAILVTSGVAAEVVTLRDVSTTSIKAVITAKAGESYNPELGEILFPNGIRVTLTQTDSSVTLLLRN